MKSESILFLGEASFSFSHSLLKAKFLSQFEHVVASTIMSRDDTVRLYPSAEQFIEMLVENGVVVLFGLDATSQMEQLEGQKFDHVVFMFPAPPLRDRGKISESRRLIQTTASCVGSVLRDNGRFLLSLAAGQGGTDADAEFRRLEGNSWKVVESCANANLFLHEARLFAKDPMCVAAMQNGYEPTGKKVKGENR